MTQRTLRLFAVHRKDDRGRTREQRGDATSVLPRVEVGVDYIRRERAQRAHEARKVAEIAPVAPPDLDHRNADLDAGSRVETERVDRNRRRLDALIVQTGAEGADDRLGAPSDEVGDDLDDARTHIQTPRDAGARTLGASPPGARPFRPSAERLE